MPSVKMKCYNTECEHYNDKMINNCYIFTQKIKSCPNFSGVVMEKETEPLLTEEQAVNIYFEAQDVCLDTFKKALRNKGIIPKLLSEELLEKANEFIIGIEGWSQEDRTHLNLTQIYYLRDLYLQSIEQLKKEMGEK